MNPAPDSRRDGIVVTRVDGAMVIRIDRPHVRNAVDAATSYAVDAALSEAEADESIGVIVLTGTGERAFCAGMDMKEAAEAGIGRGLVPGRGFCGLTERVLAKPIIAAVNGAAVAGGFELTLACDLVVAADHAVFGLSEIKRGLVAYAGGVQRLAKQMPRGLAMEIILTGEPVTAQRLHAIGLVSRVVPAADVLETALALARTMHGYSWPALRGAKELFDLSLTLPVAEALQAGHALGARLSAHGDWNEGVKAFAGHRDARFG